MTPHRPVRALLVVLLALVFAGCTLEEPQPIPVEVVESNVQWNERMLTVEALDTWSLPDYISTPVTAEYPDGTTREWDEEELESYGWVREWSHADNALHLSLKHAERLAELEARIAALEAK